MWEAGEKNKSWRLGMNIKGLKESFGIAGVGVGMGLAGEMFNSEGLKSSGEVAVGFVPIAVNIGMGATIIDMAKDLKNSKKKQ